MKLALDSDRSEFIEALIDDEELQNQTLVPFLKESILSGSSIDALVDDDTFGFTPENPIPVNGPLGQQTYLSKLRTGSGVGFFFHRLGSLGRIDIYKAVSFDGLVELELYLDMYHPRRSRKAVSGYYLDLEQSAFTGFTLTMPNFPQGYEAILNGLPESIRPAYATADQVRPFLRRTDLGTDSPFRNWKNRIHSDDWDRALEQRGYIVPTYNDAFAVAELPGVRFGWSPSKALSKRRQMSGGDLYDPMSAMVLDGWDQFQTIFEEELFEGSSLGPHRIFIDDQGPFASFILCDVTPGSALTDAFVEFFATFYCTFRKYPVEGWIADFEANPGSNLPGHTSLICFRWTTNVAILGRPFAKDGPSLGAIDAPSPYEIKGNSTLHELKCIEVGTCKLCDLASEIWCNEQQVADISRYFRNGPDDPLPTSISFDEREQLITGSHSWCLSL
jgi:hypothetical protein